VKRFLLDTNAAGHYLNRRRGVRERAAEEVARGNRIGICVPVLGELWFGVERSASRDRNYHLLRRTLSAWTVWSFDEAAAEEYGRISAVLRGMGRPMQQIDVQVAAVALTLGKTTVVSEDADLRDVPGLEVENWVTETT
jgi:tRNA(fMet)-specific endonuclease VapC